MELVDTSDFSDDFEDADLLAQADLIESQYQQQQAQHSSSNDNNQQQRQINCQSSSQNVCDDFTDDAIVMDDAALEQIDKIESSNYRPAVSSQNLVQQTLWGAPPPNKSKPIARPILIQKEHTGAKQQWNHAKMSISSKDKKRMSKDEDEDDIMVDDEPFEFEQFPNIPEEPILPMKHSFDSNAIKSWIYPTNRPVRDYQFNITEQCLFQNTLVALPTGLGKTLIAGVVMMNYYNWFPTAKVVFVAPTKPLVDQQAQACHDICGIPQSDISILTGSTAKAKRRSIYETKRVLYMTPQTLENDIKHDDCDARDIVLLVIDEAHKSQGNYSYSQVVRVMMRKNPHFRVLALTATPGNSPEQVQPIIDNLHISHIAIRNESSPDIKPYLFKKIFEEHQIETNDLIDDLAFKWEEVLRPHLERLVNVGLLKENLASRPRSLHPYSIEVLRNQLFSNPQFQGQNYLHGVITKTAELVRAMRALHIQTIDGFYKSLLHMKTGNSMKKGGPTPAQHETLKVIQPFLNQLENARVEFGGRLGHPKLDKTEALLLDHFIRHSDEKIETRAMVFASLRETVDDIVDRLNINSPIIKAKGFIGQGSREGQKGLKQKEQQAIINDFKSGHCNVLVSTSIGEEGLDIGDIDIAIVYDPSKSSISMLQKVGRTGRKRDGYVHTLMTNNVEDKNWTEAQLRHQDVQAYIVSGDQVALYDDVERLIPENVEPICEKRHIKIDEWQNNDDKKIDIKNFLIEGSATKRKRNTDPMRNVPKEAVSGFMNASKLVPKSKKKDTISMDVESDSEDEAIEKGLNVNVETNSSKSFKPSTSSNLAPKNKGNKILTKASNETLKMQSNSTMKRQPSQNIKSNNQQSIQALSKSLSLRAHSITLHDDEDPGESLGLRQNQNKLKRSRSRSPTPISPVSSPVLILNKPPPMLKSPSDSSMGVNTRPKKSFKAPKQMKKSPTTDIDSESVDSPIAAPKLGKNKDTETFKTPAKPLSKSNFIPSSVSMESSPVIINNPRNKRHDKSMNIRPFQFDPSILLKATSPNPTQMIRRPGQSLVGPPRTTGKPIISSSPRCTPYEPYKRLRQRSSSNPSPMSRPLNKKRMLDYDDYLDLDAKVSDNENVSEDERLSEIEVLSEGDIDFVAGDQSQIVNYGDNNYNQQAAYISGLSTQAPVNGPRFDNGPIKNLNGFRINSMDAHRPMLLSSSPNANDPDDTYDYEDGFVVADDCVMDSPY